MKKILIFIGLLILSIIFSVVAVNASAAEEQWYHISAENAGNDVILEDDQYFKGVSVNSHIISDLTFMEIPFGKYLDGTADEKPQIITFSEALYKRDGETDSDIVMYVYIPNGTGLEFSRISVDFEFISQKCQINNQFIDCLSDEDKGKIYTTVWSDVSQYGSIVKFTAGTYYESGYTKSIDDWLLKDYNKIADSTELQTIFDVKINKYEYYSNVLNSSFTVKNDGSEYWYASQNFQFVTAKINHLATYGMRALTESNVFERTAACVGTNTSRIKVVGETTKVRYKTDDLGQNYIPFVSYSYETEYTDVYYFLFDVFENDTKWGTEKYITEVVLDYIEAELLYEGNISTTFLNGYDVKLKGNLKFHNSNGEIALADGHETSYKVYDLNAEDTEGNRWEEEIQTKFLSQINNQSLYIRDVIKPEAITVQYLEDSIHNHWVSLTAGYYNTKKATYLTLFNSKSSDLNQYIDVSDTEMYELIIKHQFGVIFGNEKGYPVYENSHADLSGAITTRSHTLAAVAGVAEIEYKENNTIHRVIITDNEIDNSGIFNPIKPGDDGWLDAPGDDKPKTPDDPFWKFIQDILNFFNITLPAWWDENHETILGFTLVLVVVIVVILIVRFIQKRKAEKALLNISNNKNNRRTSRYNNKNKKRRKYNRKKKKE